MAVARRLKDVPDNLAMDGAGDAVLELEVHLGDRVLGEDGGVRDVTCVGILSVHQFSFIPDSSLVSSSSVSCARSIGVWYSRDRRTDGGGLNHVADGESLDGLVLGGASRAVGATDGLDVAPAVLVAAAAKKTVVSLGPW